MSRHFKNPFPEYSSEAAKGLLEVTELGTTVSSEYKSRLLKILDDLQATIEEKTKKWNSSNDYSIYTGTAGSAIMYLNRFDRLGDNHALQKAEEIALHCSKAVGSKSRFTFLCGDGGVLAVAAIVAQSAGKQSPLGDPEKYVKKLVSLSEHALASTDLPDELLYGRTGCLYSLLLLQSHGIGGSSLGPLLPRFTDLILESGRALAAREGLTAVTPLMYEWHGKKYFGAAHGLVGILVVLMQAIEYLPAGALQEQVRPAVDYLEKQLFPSGNLPSSDGSGSGDKLVHWCHGAPGAVVMFTMASRVFQHTPYLKTARRCADVVWQRGLLKKGYGLCHGASGNGYCLLYLYQETKEPEYLYKACQFGVWCQQYGQHGCGIPDRPYSLFEGLAGNAHFLHDLLDVDNAAFPGFILPVKR